MTQTACFITAVVICGIIGYLLGSISFAVIFTKKYAGTDVREHGSKNAGMTNVMRIAGKLPGMLTFVFDFLKGTAAVLIGKIFGMWLTERLCESFGTVLTDDATFNPMVIGAAAGIFSLIGHMYPVFFSFKGGKGVATIAGIEALLDWRAMLISFAVFLLLVLITRYVSLSSIISSAVVTALTYLFYSGGENFTFTVFGMSQRATLTVAVGICALLIILKHHDNIGRLINKTERKINLKKTR